MRAPCWFVTSVCMPAQVSGTRALDLDRVLDGLGMNARVLAGYEFHAVGLERLVGGGEHAGAMNVADGRTGRILRVRVDVPHAGRP